MGEDLVCGATVRKEKHIGFSHAFIHSLRGLFVLVVRHILLHHQREAKEREASVVNGFFPIYWIGHDDVNPSLGNLSVPSQNIRHLTRTSKPNDSSNEELEHFLSNQICNLHCFNS